LRILFDQGVPKPLQQHLTLHAVKRAYELGWDRKKNGELLALAQNEGFGMLVTTDQRLRYQQNLSGLRLANCESRRMTGTRTRFEQEDLSNLIILSNFNSC